LTQGERRSNGKGAGDTKTLAMPHASRRDPADLSLFIAVTIIAQKLLHTLRDFQKPHGDEQNTILGNSEQTKAGRFGKRQR
jgi:hypothetical protein